MPAHFTPQAEIDLEEVGDYIALDNPRRAVSFIREIRQHCEKIADGPHRYVARPDLGDAVLIQCWHLHQQTPITGATPLIDESPEVTGAFRGYLLICVTEVHVGYVYTESA